MKKGYPVSGILENEEYIFKKHEFQIRQSGDDPDKSLKPSPPALARALFEPVYQALEVIPAETLPYEESCLDYEAGNKQRKIKYQLYC